MPHCSVLRVNAIEEQAAYRGAVAEILRRVQIDHDITLLEISERIDVSLGTISNAANKKADLNPIYLKRLGEVFGPATLDPYVKLIGGRVIPLETPDTADILPLITIAAHKVAKARDPQSPGGVRETLSEKLDYLPELRRVRYEVGALIASIEAEAA